LKFELTDGTNVYVGESEPNSTVFNAKMPKGLKFLFNGLIETQNFVIRDENVVILGGFVPEFKMYHWKKA
jgi:hypothetical protein